MSDRRLIRLPSITTRIAGDAKILDFYIELVCTIA